MPWDKSRLRARYSCSGSSMTSNRSPKAPNTAPKDAPPIVFTGGKGWLKRAGDVVRLHLDDIEWISTQQQRSIT